MFKKLLVFLLAFGLGLISLKVITSKIETSIQNANQNSEINDNSQPARNPLFIKVDNFLYKFQKAIAEDDRKTVVSLVNFPVEIGFINKNGQKYEREIKSESDFLKNYDKIFDNSFKSFISQIKSNQFLYITSGEIFSGRSGLKIKPFYHDNNNFELKIIRLNKLLKYNAN